MTYKSRNDHGVSRRCALDHKPAVETHLYTDNCSMIIGMDNISSSHHYNDTTPMHRVGEAAQEPHERHTEARLVLSIIE